MIHDATVEVTCDNDCGESVYVDLEWVYQTRVENSGHYDHNEAKTVRKLVDDHDWVVRDGKHFCSPECAAR